MPPLSCSSRVRLTSSSQGPAASSSPARARWVRRRIFLAIAATALFWIVAALARYGYWVRVEHRFQRIAPQVYQSGAIPPEELDDVVREHGIRTVIDVRKEVGEGDVASEARTLQGLGVRHVYLPFEDVPDGDTLAAFLGLMSEPETYPALIHCYHGWGRSRLLAAVYRMEFEGWDAERARRETRWLTTVFTSFDVGEPKGEFLRRYVPRHR